MTDEKPRERLAARLWRKRRSIALWGGTFLLCDLVWRIAWIYTIEAQPQPPWWGLMQAAAVLPLTIWFYLNAVGAKDNYRALILAGKINPPEVAGAINAVKLKPKKKQRSDPSDWFDPDDIGKPDPGYGRGISWAPKPFQGPLFFLCCLVLFVAPFAAERYLGVLIGNEFPIHLGGLLPAWLLAALASGYVIERRHKKIWADIRASQPIPPQ